MKNILKRISCLALVVLLVLSFAACTKNNESSNTSFVENDPGLEKLVNEQGDSFEALFEESFSSTSGGLECDCKLSVKGTTLVLDNLVENINDVPEETKEEMQAAYEEAKDELAEGFKPIKTEAPGMSEVIFNVCEEDGDVIASVVISF